MPVLPAFLALLWAPVRFGEMPPTGLPGRSDTVVVGKWADGFRTVPVEEITWLSPFTVLRLGWNWEQSRARFDGALTFVVRLMALERQDPLEFGGHTAPGDDVSRAGFAAFADVGSGKWVPLPAEVVVRWSQHARDPHELLRVPPLAFVYDDLPRSLPLNVGRNQVAVYEVRVPLNAIAETAVRYRVCATTARRTREAVFQRWPRIESVR